MRIVICAKEVLDPDAVNGYALEGKLVIGDDGRTLTQASIPRLMNAYDEQGIEAALRLREAGVSCTITVVTVGAEPGEILKHAAAMGVDETVAIPLDVATVDHHVVAALLAAWVEGRGGADVILCGRQASDDDQGVVPALLGEHLAVPVVTVARAVEVAAEGEARRLRVVRVTPDGEETVEVACPAIVTISNELGPPRYPTMAGRMAARKKRPTVVAPETLALAATDRRPRVRVVRQFVPTVKGACELIEGASPVAAADALVARLRAEGVLR